MTAAHGPALAARLRTFLWRLVEASAVICIPLLLVTSSANTVVNSSLLYRYGFGAYQIPTRTGIPMDQLLSVAEQTKDFFNAEDDLPLRVTIVRGGQAVPLYNEREVAHMQDVRELMRQVRAVSDATLTYLLALLGIGLWVRKIAFVPAFIGILFRGSAATLGLVALAGIASVFDFEDLFLQFHLFSFSNNLWLLDPTKDYLLMMYPWGFFRDATLAIGGLIALVAAALLALSKLMAERIDKIVPPSRP